MNVCSNKDRRNITNVITISPSIFKVEAKHFRLRVPSLYIYISSKISYFLKIIPRAIQLSEQKPFHMKFHKNTFSAK